MPITKPYKVQYHTILPIQSKTAPRPHTATPPFQFSFPHLNIHLPCSYPILFQPPHNHNHNNQRKVQTPSAPCSAPGTTSREFGIPHLTPRTQTHVTPPLNPQLHTTTSTTRSTHPLTQSREAGKGREGKQQPHLRRLFYFNFTYYT